MRRPAGGHIDSRPKAARWFHLPARDPRRPQSVSIQFNGGPEAWYEIHARGSIGRYPGYTAIHDIMTEINRTQ